jgi:hypothetical protein
MRTLRFVSYRSIRVFALAACLLAAGASASAQLSGSGQLPLPAGCPNPPNCSSTAPGIGPTISANVSTGFTGTWSPNVAAPWVGTITATATGIGSGPSYPSSVVDASTTVWDFSLVGAGFLPVGTFVLLGDVDSGSSGSEQFDLSAFGAANALITTPWLDLPVRGTSANPGDFTAGSMPDFSWNAGVYSFTGANVLGNPTLSVWLQTNTNVFSLSVQKYTTNNGFGLAAPAAVPEPASLLTFGFGLLGVVLYRKMVSRKNARSV